MKVTMKLVDFYLCVFVFVLSVPTECTWHTSDSSQVPSVCYGILGCFNLTNDFYDRLYRPTYTNKLPTTPEYFNTTIFFYTRLTRPKVLIVPKIWYTSDNFTDKLDNFDGTKQTKMIITGYRDNPYFSNWMQEIRDELLDSGDFNVFIVDWSNATRETRLLIYQANY